MRRPRRSSGELISLLNQPPVWAVASGERDDVVTLAEFVPELLAATGGHPGILLVQRQAERQRREKPVRGRLANKVIGRRVATAERGARHRIVDLERPHLGTARIGPNAHVTIGHLLDAPGEIFGRAVEVIQRRGPGCDHFETELAVARDDVRREHGAGGCGAPETDPLDEFPALHGCSLRLVCDVGRSPGARKATVTAGARQAAALGGCRTDYG